MFVQSPKPDTPDLIHTLPGEVRNRIYELAIGSDQEICIRRPRLRFATEPPLLRVSKAIRREAGEIYVSTKHASTL